MVLIDEAGYSAAPNTTSQPWQHKRASLLVKIAISQTTFETGKLQNAPWAGPSYSALLKIRGAPFLHFFFLIYLQQCPASAYNPPEQPLDPAEMPIQRIAKPSVTETGSPPRTTEPPYTNSTILALLLKRDSYPVSICGWIDGDGGKPAYCSAYSSCVRNTDNSYVGCCATASNACRFFTSCVDVSSSQIEDLQDVYTCKGAKRCYRNSFPDDFYQWGCGALDDATTVLTSYDGINTDLTLQVVYTGNGAGEDTVEPTTTSEDTTPGSFSHSLTNLGTPPASPLSTLVVATITVGTETRTATPSPGSSEQADPNKDSSGLSTGAKAGIGAGAAFGGLLILGAMVFLVWRWRKRRNGHSGLPVISSQSADAGGYYNPVPMSGPSELESTERSLFEMSPVMGDAKYQGKGKTGLVDDGREVFEVPG
ncbi:hypothetical protein BDW74DRAFT_176628 [Aspergillus multicolor]|uniref:uncharacterized protein n=1 Tax=Aspergillus multicolor TaxID=41759 RepID=UPI003CCD96D6